MAEDTTTPEFDLEERKRKAEAAAKAAPMAAAPMKYAEDGSVDWGNMWDSFCVLALDGGPSHRSTLLEPDTDSDPADPAYQTALREIIRGIYLVSGLPAKADAPGWIAVQCGSEGMAEWLADAGLKENVRVRHQGSVLYVPCGTSFAVKGEIKNVITVVAKTTHYWQDHIPDEVKTTLVIEDRLRGIGQRIKSLFKR